VGPSLINAKVVKTEYSGTALRPPVWLLVMLALCFAVAVLRTVLLLAHEPLIALANSYDEVRYTACFDLYPDRSATVEPTRNSPEAPYAHYRFLPNENPICYWSSELLFQGAAAAVFRVEEALSHDPSHSVRWIGVLKFAALLGVWLAFTRAWLRRRAYAAALANGLLLPLLFADPANTVYLDTFYAEWTALLAMYTLCGLILLDFGTRGSRRQWLLLVLAAFALATSKIQHLLLPLACALVLFGLDWLRARRWSWQGKAVLVGAIAGLALQCVQLGRDSDAIRAIDMFNRADVTFTGLLPNARDPAATAAKLGLDIDCLRYTGLRAWQMQDYPGHACPSLAHVTRGRELAVLVSEPDLTLRLGWHGVLALEPWLAPGLGLVEGGEFQALPDDFSTFSHVLTALPLLRVLLLSAPLLALPALLLAGLGRGRLRMLAYTAITVVVMVGTLTITILGDGLADTPKQGHLVLNAALAWWICIVMLGASRSLRRTRRAASSSETSRRG